MDLQEFLSEYDHIVEDQDLILFIKNNTNDGELCMNYKEYYINGYLLVSYQSFSQEKTPN